MSLIIACSKELRLDAYIGTCARYILRIVVHRRFLISKFSNTKKNPTIDRTNLYDHKGWIQGRFVKTSLSNECLPACNNWISFSPSGQHHFWSAFSTGACMFSWGGKLLKSDGRTYASVWIYSLYSVVIFVSLSFSFIQRCAELFASSLHGINL